MTKQIHATRESWLVAAVGIMREWFKEAKYDLPKTIRVSVGFPSRNALSNRNRAIGQCWDGTSSKDGSTHIFISPVLSEASRVGDVLVHELVHASVKSHGHRGEFTRVAKAMGLTGKMTATVATAELVKRLNIGLKPLGSYPHAALDPAKNPVKKQGARLLKAECGGCGYVIRVTRKWIDEAGLPTCPCGTEFEESE